MILFLLITDLPSDPKTLYELGINSFNSKNYKQAEKIFKRIIYGTSPNEWTDKAQYYLALVYFNTKQYELAKSELEFFINNFRYSEFYPDGLILLSKVYYLTSPNEHRDISQLEKAIELLERIKALYPNSEYEKRADSVLYLVKSKFAKKILSSAQLYRKLQKFESEAIYLEYYLKNYIEISPDSVALRLFEIYELGNKKGKILELSDLVIKSDYFSNWIKKIALEKREKHGYSSDRR